MRKPPDWAEAWLRHQDEEVRQFILENFDKKVVCLLTDEGKTLAAALVYLYLNP